MCWFGHKTFYFCLKLPHPATLWRKTAACHAFILKLIFCESWLSVLYWQVWRCGTSSCFPVHTVLFMKTDGGSLFWKDEIFPFPVVFSVCFIINTEMKAAGDHKIKHVHHSAATGDLSAALSSRLQHFICLTWGSGQASSNRAVVDLASYSSHSSLLWPSTDVFSASFQWVVRSFLSFYHLCPSVYHSESCDFSSTGSTAGRDTQRLKWDWKMFRFQLAVLFQRSH